MRIVVALGGNALLKRGEALSANAQLRNVKLAAAQIAAVAEGNEIVIVHGNGPQVGMLAALAQQAPSSERFPLDVLDAETEGMIGYLLELELRNRLPATRPLATLLTMVEVDAADPAFQHPDKPVGAMLSLSAGVDTARANGWTVAKDGNGYRRVVPSPQPLRILEIESVRALLAQHTVVICAGGGGIPVVAGMEGQYGGIEAVVDKDRSAALLAHEIRADLFVIATDVDGVYADWGTPAARPIRELQPEDLATHRFAAGSMEPKVEAACDFARRSGKRAMIGALSDLDALVAGRAGTSVSVGGTGKASDEPDSGSF